MKKNAYAVGVIGTDLIGREVVSALEERQFPVASLRVFDEGDARGEAVDFKGGEVAVEPIEAGIGGIDIALLARDRRLEEGAGSALSPRGSVVIDCCGVYALDREVPLVVPECNAAALAGYTARRIVSSPDAVAVALSAVLAPLHRRAGVRRAVVTTFEGVSGAGAAGIDELSRQTVDVLSGRSVESEVFPGRVCFNVLPWVGESGSQGQGAAEERAADHVRKVLGGAPIEMSISRVRVPIFYGIGLTVNAELANPASPGSIRELLRESPGILFAGDGVEEETVTVADAIGQDATLVSRVRADDSVENGVNLWVAIDNIRKGHAINAVQIAEVLIRDYL